MAAVFDDKTHDRIGSDLVMEHIVCDRISFDRYGLENKASEAKVSMKYDVSSADNSVYRGTLTISILKEDEYRAEVQISAFFSVNEDTLNGEELVTKNGLAIIFPFARSQISLLTSQPETTPVVLPVVNINKVFENADKS